MEQRMINENPGVNILTNSRSVIVDGAEELLTDFSEGKISADELSERLLDLEVVYVDRSQAKEFKEVDEQSRPSV
jgi:hypothetical protein